MNTKRAGRGLPREVVLTEINEPVIRGLRLKSAYLVNVTFYNIIWSGSYVERRILVVNYVVTFDHQCGQK